MTTSDIRWIQRFSNYNKALRQLTKFIERGELNELEEQGLIQAFEYTHELSWKTLKDFLEHRGNKEIYGSRDVSRLAFKSNLIENGEAWMSMIQSRNLTTHTYNEDTAAEISNAITSSYYPEFIKLRDKLEKLLEVEQD